MHTVMRRIFLVYGAMTPALSIVALAQAPPPYPNYEPQPSYQQPAPQATPLLSPQQLSNLVAPIALYPDLLLSEVLAASTYPLELVQAQQWIQGNPGLHGPDLVNAAKQQNWDPSVQALVAFPDVMNLLTRDVQWTTDLGNAFLAQQAGVMDAIQQLRASARANGRLMDTPQERVTMDQENGQSAIVIQPTDPQVVYPPVYNPEYVWGPPVYGAYPPLFYPPPAYGIGYTAGIFLGGLFSGLMTFGGWGWGLSWLTHGLFLNGLFFSHFGFHGGYGYGGYGFRGGAYAAHSAWVHDPGHRLGVPYGNRAVATRFGGSFGGRGGSGFTGGNFRNSYAARSYSAGSYNNRQMDAYRGLTNNRSLSTNRGFSDNRGFSNNRGLTNRGAAPRSSYESRSFSSPHYSAPNSSAHFGRGGGGGHSGGGHSGGHGHSGGGGGRSHGGSHHK